MQLGAQRLSLNPLLRRGLSTAPAVIPPKQLPKEAEVVIVGGGVIGCSVAYHLSKLMPGEGRIILLEAQ